MDEVLMPRATRQKLIETAYELLDKHGLEAVGVDQIIRAAGLTKSTFYNHFDSRDDLLAAVLRWLDERSTQGLRAMLRERAGVSARGQLMVLIDAIEEVWGREGRHGCLFIAAAGLHPHPHDPVHRAVRSHVAHVRELLHELAGYAGAKNPRALADELAVVIAGVYALGQMGEPDAVEDARALARATVEAHLPQVAVRVRRVRGYSSSSRKRATTE